MASARQKLKTAASACDTRDRCHHARGAMPTGRALLLSARAASRLTHLRSTTISPEGGIGIAPLPPPRACTAPELLSLLQHYFYE